MPFQTFSRSLVPLKREPTVTIQKRGTLALNKSAHVTLGSPDAVALLYDPDAHLIGISPVDASTRDAFFVRSSSTNGAGPYVITAMAFVRFYDINIDVSRRWTALLIDSVLCVDLTTPGTPVTSNRAHAPTYPIDASETT